MREQQRTSSSSRQEINNKLTISLLPPTREHKREEILDRVYFSLSVCLCVGGGGEEGEVIKVVSSV